MKSHAVWKAGTSGRAPRTDERQSDLAPDEQARRRDEHADGDDVD